jgi:predicted hydrocarbon binding protein
VNTPQAQTAQRKYAFSWDLLGNIQEGRPNLGPMTRLEVYRLMQFCFRDILEQEFGSPKADDIFYRAGYTAGGHFYDHAIGPTPDLGAFVKKLQDVLREMGIGVLRVEEADLENGRLVLTVSEDLDCSGLPELGYEVCTYDEGFIAALLQRFSGKKFKVKEIDCWCTGDRTCRFLATVETA